MRGSRPACSAPHTTTAGQSGHAGNLSELHCLHCQGSTWDTALLPCRLGQPIHSYTGHLTILEHMPGGICLFPLPLSAPSKLQALLPSSSAGKEACVTWFDAFETGSCYTVQAVLKFTVPLALPPKCGTDRYAPSHPDVAPLFNGHTLCLLKNHFHLSLFLFRGLP